jgi:glycosyltransferase involved in cell wall biosynthesis
LGVDVEMFAPETGLRESSPTIVNVGSLQPVKGQAILIRAFRFVADRKANVRLVIAGAGELRSELELLTAELNLSDRVHFLGDVRHEQLPAVYRDATLFVQASLHEAQGMAVLEAAACGLPIAGTMVGALADLAPDAALAVPPGDPIRLAQLVLSVLDDPQRLRTLGQAARARVVETYSLDASADRFERLYHR